MFYNVYLHPLSKYPGPKLWAATMIPFVNALIKGNMAIDCKRIHDQYGDIVRISPWELSYRNADAWKDIYANRNGHILLPKEPFFYSPVNGHPNIVFSDHATHARIRRTVANAFSEKALRQQEDLIKVHIDLLVERLDEMADGKTPLDIVMWYNYCTFDLIGDLSLGQTFGCLRNSELHPWVRMQFLINQSFSFFLTASLIPFGFKIFDFIIGTGVLKARQEHVALTEQAVKLRLGTKTERPDFLHFMQRDIGSVGDRLSVDELVSNAGALISAGSETTATLLSGATYHLLRNPEVMSKLCQEIRGAFKSDMEINTAAVSGLKYLQAVVDEALRCYPPVPTGLPRIVPKGGEVLVGRYVPSNVRSWPRNPSRFTSLIMPAITRRLCLSIIGRPISQKSTFGMPTNLSLSAGWEILNMLMMTARSFSLSRSALEFALAASK